MIQQRLIHAISGTRQYIVRRIFVLIPPCVKDPLYIRSGPNPRDKDALLGCDNRRERPVVGRFKDGGLGPNGRGRARRRRARNDRCARPETKRPAQSYSFHIHERLPLDDARAAQHARRHAAPRAVSIYAIANCLRGRTSRANRPAENHSPLYIR